jgi:hypothetical protein
MTPKPAPGGAANVAANVVGLGGNARLVGCLGSDGENAVALWRQAFAEGYYGAYPTPFSWHWIAIEPLRDYPPFQELMRPKG